MALTIRDTPLHNSTCVITYLEYKHLDVELLGKIRLILTHLYVFIVQKDLNPKWNLTIYSVQINATNAKCSAEYTSAICFFFLKSLHTTIF